MKIEWRAKTMYNIEQKVMTKKKKHLCFSHRIAEPLGEL